MADQGADLELANLTVGTADVLKTLQALNEALKAAAGNAENLGAVLQKSLNIGQNPAGIKQLRQTLGLLRGGDANAQLTNAGIQGALNTKRGSSIGAFAQVANNELKIQNEIAKAVGAQIELFALKDRRLKIGNDLQMAERDIMRQTQALAEKLAASGGVRTADIYKDIKALQAQKAAFADRVEQERLGARLAAKYESDQIAAVGRQTQLFMASKAQQAKATAAEVAANTKMAATFEAAQAENLSRIGKQAAAIAKQQSLQYAGVERIAVAQAAADEENIARLGRQAALIAKNKTAEIAATEKAAAAQLRATDQQLAAQDKLARQQERDAAIAFRNSPAGILAQGQRNRDIRNASLFGDGGASLFGLQARLLGQFAILNTAFSGFRFLKDQVIQLDAELNQLQAIAAVSNNQMAILKDTIVGVAEASKFTVVEIAQAATSLAQFGLTAKQISEVLSPITQFAQAVGGDLKTSVDIFSSVLSVFNLQTSEAGHVADVLTGAMNRSKLTVDKLALGLQYSGNIAAQAGVSFEELSTILAAVSNAGVKSGSTLGTGVRRLLTELLAPTEKFKTELRGLGIGLEEIDVKSQGFIGALKNLAKSGFTSENALRAFEQRSAAAFAAIAGQLDTIDALGEGIQTAGSTAAASEIQMKSLANQAARFGATASAIANKAVEPLTKGLAKLLSVLADGLTGLSKFSDVLGFLATFASLAGSLALITWLTRLTKLLPTAIGLFTTLGSVMRVAAGGFALSGITGAITQVANLVNPVTALITLVVAAGAAFLTFSSKTKTMAEKLDDTRAQLEEVNGRLDDIRGKLAAVGDELQKVTDRSVRLRDNQGELKSTIDQLKDRFGAWGLTISDNVTNVDALTDALVRFQAQLAKTSLSDLTFGSNLQTILQNQLISEAGSLFGLKALNGLEVPGLRFNRQARTSSGTLGQADLSGVDPRLQAAVNLLLNGQSSDLASEQGRRSLKDQLGLAAQGLSQVPANSPLFETVKTLKDQLEKINVALSNVAQSIAAKNQLDVGAKSAAFTASDFGQATALQIQTGQNQLKNIEAQIGASTDNAEKERLAHQAVDITAKIGDLIHDKLEKLGADTQTAFDKSPQSDALAKLEGAANSLLETTMNGVNEQNAKILDLVISRRKRAFESILKSVDGDLSRPEIDAKQQQAIKEFNAYAGAQMAKLALDLRGKGLQAGDAEYDQGFEELKATLDSERDDLLQNFKNKIEQFFGAMQELADIPENFTKSAKTINDKLKNDVKVAGLPVDAINNQLKSLDLPSNQGKFSDLDKQVLTDRLEGVTNTSLQAQTRLYGVAAAELTKKLRDLDEELVTNKTRHDELNNELEKATLTGNELNAVKKEGAAVDARIQKLEAARVTLVDGITDALTNQTAAQDELNQRTADYEEIPFGEKVGVAITQFDRANSVGKSFLSLIGDGFPDILNNIRDGIKGAVDAWVRGTGTMGDAFRAFAQGVIEKMLDIAETAAANQITSLLGQGLKIGLGLLSPGGGYAAGNPGVGPGGLGFLNFGGPRAAGGPVTGGTPGRDSVLTPTMPGEWVVRKSAVDAVGHDFMNALNQGKMPRSAQIIPVGVGGQKQPVNVWVVQPNQVPPPGPRDIIATIAQDIQKGGVTKKLIKTVMAGA